MAEANRTGDTDLSNRTRLVQWARSQDWLKRAYRRLSYETKKGKLRTWIHFLAAGHLVRKLRVYSFLRRPGAKFLQVGGGYHVRVGAGWINADLIAGDIYCNATRPLPFPDNSIDFIFTEQFIEHLPQQHASTFMKEAFRVLVPGGVMRQSTPELPKLIDIYQDRAAKVSRCDAVDRHMRVHRGASPFAVANGCQYLNDLFSLWGHQFIYDEETLRSLSASAGFVGFERSAFGESSCPELRGLERHADTEWLKTEVSIFYEARKPRV